MSSCRVAGYVPVCTSESANVSECLDHTHGCSQGYNGKQMHAHICGCPLAMMLVADAGDAITWLCIMPQCLQGACWGLGAHRFLLKAMWVCQLLYRVVQFAGCGDGGYPGAPSSGGCVGCRGTSCTEVESATQQAPFIP